MVGNLGGLFRERWEDLQVQEMGVSARRSIHGSGVKVIMEKLTLILIDSITERSIICW